MKIIIKYISVVILAFLNMGCDDFLTELPQSAYSVEGAYRTQQDFELGIAACYNTIQDLHRPFRSWFLINQGRGDEYLNGSSFDGMNNFTVDAQSREVLNGWKLYWKLVTYSNTVLDKIDQGEFLDADVQKYIKGEAYMMRAYAYYALGWNWGGVPLLDKSYTVEEVNTIPRSSQDATFSFAESDYLSAIDLLPEEWQNENKGRVTKYAAQAMLGRLYMFQKKGNLAKPLFESVMQSGKYDYAVNYEDCFNDAFDNSQERIWEAQFSGGQIGEGTGTLFTQLPNGIENLEYAPVGGGAGAVRINDLIYDSYEAGDSRRDISILINPVIDGVTDVIAKYAIKFNHFTYVPKDNLDYANNLPIIRYTDVALLYAEILNDESYIADGEAFNIVNVVRARAGLPALSSATVTNQDEFTEALRKERKFEFAFEGIRWRDLLRWDVALDVMNDHLSTVFTNTNWSMEPYNEILPIPFDEIIRYDNSNVMWQNPGY